MTGPPFELPGDQPSTQPADHRLRHVLVVLVLVILVGIVAAAAYARGNAPANPGRAGIGVAPSDVPALQSAAPAAVPPIGSADIPPPGAIWFGRSFDPTSFAIHERITQVGTGTAFSFVAHLPEVIDASNMAVGIFWNGTLVSTTSSGASGSGDVWGFSPGPLLAAGVWKYELTDLAGNVLASGSITAK